MRILYYTLEKERYYFSEANCSSRSKRSRLGGGSSLRVGGNTAAWSAGIGVSNWGGMRVMGSCLIPSYWKSCRESGIRSVSNLYSLLLNRLVKFLGSSSASWRHDLSLSARAVISGTWAYSWMSTSSLMCLSNSASPSVSNHLNIAS